MPKQYMVELAQDERDELEAVLKSSTRRAMSATKLQRARILLAVDQGGGGGCWPGTDGHAGGGCAGGDGADLPARASAGGGAGSDEGSGA